MKLGRAVVVQRQVQASLEEAQAEQISLKAKYSSLQAGVSSLAVKKDKLTALAIEEQEILQNVTIELTTARQKLVVFGAEASAREVSIATKEVEIAQNQVTLAQEVASIARKNALTTASKFYTTQKQLENTATVLGNSMKKVEATQ